ncbi:unnamed protein product [Ostreobium quekettii]|uniref:Uncharacterized protein n=1 Tax=Ostreobium quekettii TaxID=121088 RepID=A0A8S1J3M5_9CHLO|nr:unnamed protein product [Ostreobium quekettii]
MNQGAPLRAWKLNAMFQFRCCCTGETQRPRRPRIDQREARIRCVLAVARGGSGDAGEKGIGAREGGVDLPTQGQAAVRGLEGGGLQTRERPPADIDYLTELIAIQQNAPKNIGFFGTRNMGITHQKLVEILSYTLVTSGNHIYTSGATGTNAAVIRGALRAEQPDLLTVVLPQSKDKQPQESQELLGQVQNVVEMPWNDTLSLYDASR